MWQFNIWQFRTHSRQLRSPMHIQEVQRDLMKWAVRREAKGLDTRSLHTAIYYLNEYKSIASRAEMIEEGLCKDKEEDMPLPSVNGFESRL